MAKSNKQSYESKWQKLFEEAEVQPSAQLWKNIESDLNAAENAKFKRRLLFYRTVSAAAVACMVILGIYSWRSEFGPSNSSEKITVVNPQSNNTADNTSETEALTRKADELKSPENSGSALRSVETIPSQEENRTKTAETDKTPTQQLQITNGIDKVNTETFTPPLAENQSVLPGHADEKDKNEMQRPDVSYPGNTLLYASETYSLIDRVSTQGIDDRIIMNKNLNEPVAAIYPIPIMPKHKKDEFQPVFFAGLNLSTDYFNPNYDTQSGQASVATNLFAYESSGPVYNLAGGKADGFSEGSVSNRNLGEENTAQLSFSYGANFGVALSKHWIIESGLAYSKYNTSSQTFAAFQGISADEAYPVSVANNSAENFRQFSSVRYEPTQLTNTFDFVAVPVKIGYNLSFNQISIVFGTGMAANFLLQNSISDDAGQLNEVTITPDENSPFRKVYYSGILSSGIHYQLMEKYAFSITPSYNFSISSLTKSESNFISQPYTFGIDFGIRYQF